MIKVIIEQSFRYFAKIKHITHRVIGYINILNAFLLMLTFKKVYDIDIHAGYLILGGVVLFMLIGLLDYIFVLKHEYEHINAKNDIKHDIIEIKEILKNSSLKKG